MVSATVASLALACAGELTITMDHRPASLGAQAHHFDSLADEQGKENAALCDPNVRQITGYLKLGDQDKEYFFWFFESRDKPKEDPLVLWMTGGPGCSSGIALFHENGPCTPHKNGVGSELNPYSWNNHANMIYIDQPAGTGFSKGVTDTDEAGVSADMYTFLTEFLTKYDEYAKLPFVVFGESYGGHYVPAVAHRVWKNNQNPPAGAPHINLSGVGVGNGLTDPVIQYEYYAEKAYNSTYSPRRVSEKQYYEMVEATPKCIEMIKECNTQGFPKAKCVSALGYCNSVLMMPYRLSGYNVYDMRKLCGPNPLCYDFSDVDAYLNSPEVQRALGVNKKWESCNMEVNQMMAGDWMRNYEDQIPELLAANIPVLIYAGDQDFICNYESNRAWTLAMDWPGKEAFNQADEQEWIVNGESAGSFRTHAGFTMMRVAQAGHMVPLDQPENALVMFLKFIGGEPF